MIGHWTRRWLRSRGEPFPSLATGSILVAFDPGVFLHRAAIGFIVLVAVGLGIVWTLINFYSYYPLVQRSIEIAVARFSSTSTDDPRRDAGIDRIVTEEGFIFPPSRTEVSAALPSITLLVPAYEEADVIANSIRSIYRATYLRRRLNVTVIVEPDDDATRVVLEELSSEYPFETLVVPEGYPGKPNKPRALNYGFEHADGEIVGIVDAEVVIGEDLLVEAAGALTDGADFALSHLDMVNEDDGWLNLLFRAEYGYWYYEFIPAFEHVGYPIPLGGTSCFFRRSVLESISESRIEEYGSPWSANDRSWLSDRGLDGAVPWDPENVTEDFELGLYLWMKSYEFEFLSGETQEESPIGLQGWMQQRTRWKKGKLYTFLKYVKHPPGTLLQRFHLYWQSLLPHLGPINIAGLIFVLWLANLAGAIPPPLVQGILGLGLAFLVIVSLLYARGYWVVSDKPFITKVRRTIVVALTLYFYWILQWIADVRALVQTYHGQFHWEKTTHLGRNVVTGFGIEEIDLASDAGSHFLRGGTDDNGGTVLDPSFEGPADSERRISKSFRLGALAGIVLLAAAVRVYGLTHWSLWLDEIYTITFRAAIPIREMLVIPWDPHPPLYFLLLHFWMNVGGETQVSAGLFSVVFSIATVAMTYRFSRYLYDDLTGLVAAGLIAISTMHVHFGRNIRMYSLFTFLALASWYAYVRLPEQGYRTDTVYLVATVAVLYTHIYAIFVLAAQHVYTALTETDEFFQRRWVRLQVTIGVLYSPWLAVLGQQVFERIVGRGDTAIGWIPPPSTALLRDTFLMSAGFPSFYPILAGSALTWGVALAVLLVINVTIFFAVVVYRPDDNGGEYCLVDLDQASLLGSFFFVPIAVPFIASYLFFPIYFPRFVIAASIPLYVLVARGLVNLRYQRSWQVAFAGTILVGAAVTGAGYYTGESVEDWRGVVDGIEGDVRADDLLVIQPFWVENDIRYYYDGPAAETVTLPGSDGVEPGDRFRLANRTATHDTVWVIRYQSNRSDGVLSTLNETHDRTLAREDGEITVYRFQHPSVSNRSRTPGREFR